MLGHPTTTMMPNQHLLTVVEIISITLSNMEDLLQAHNSDKLAELQCEITQVLKHQLNIFLMCQELFRMHLDHMVLQLATITT